MCASNTALAGHPGTPARNGESGMSAFAHAACNASSNSSKERCQPRARFVGFPDLVAQTDKLKGRLETPVAVDENGTNVYLLSGSDGEVAGTSDRDCRWQDPNFSIALEFLKARCSHSMDLDSQCSLGSQPGTQPSQPSQAALLASCRSACGGGYISHTQLLTRSSGKATALSCCAWGPMCPVHAGDRSPTSVLSCRDETESVSSVSSGSVVTGAHGGLAARMCGGGGSGADGSTPGVRTYASVAALGPLRPVRRQPLPTAGFAARAAAYAAAKRRARMLPRRSCLLGEEWPCLADDALASAVIRNAAPAAQQEGQEGQGKGQQEGVCTQAHALTHVPLTRQLWPEHLPIPPGSAGAAERTAAGASGPQHSDTARRLRKCRSLLRVRREAECHLMAPTRVGSGTGGGAECCSGVEELEVCEEALGCWGHWMRVQLSFESHWFGAACHAH